MADRIVALAWAKPKRRAGLALAVVIAIAAAVLVAGGLSDVSRAAKPRGHAVSAATRQQISDKVGGLIAKMTVAEKFGQLEMSGPTGTNGSPGQTLLDEAKAGQVGSVLDLVGVDNINQVQQAALNSRLHIPLIFGLDVIHGYRTMFPVPLGEAAS